MLAPVFELQTNLFKKTKVAKRKSNSQPELNDRFWRGTAMVLQGESLKASEFVTHAASLGVLREKIFRRILTEHVIGKFSVETGFVTAWQNHINGVSEQLHSKQIDILVHDHLNHAPQYRYDDFVVVNYGSFRAGVEVKSYLDSRGFQEILDVERSVRQLIIDRFHDGKVPRANLRKECFGFAIDGVKFETAKAYYSDLLSSTVKMTIPELPLAVACDAENYFFLRPTMTVHREEWLLLAIQAKNKSDLGVATAMLVGTLCNYLNGAVSGTAPLVGISQYLWFNSLPDQLFEKSFLDQNGNWIESQRIPINPTD